MAVVKEVEQVVHQLQDQRLNPQLHMSLCPCETLNTKLVSPTCSICQITKNVNDAVESLAN